jgi:hypothetical protein
MTVESLRDLLGDLRTDGLRRTVPFDTEMSAANKALLDPGKSDFEVAQVLRSWLKKHQPCLFGRIGASAPDLLSFCILREPELTGSGFDLRKKIKAYRQQWKRDAYRGKKSAFIVAAIAPSLIAAAPDEKLLAFAQKLCEQYLLQAIDVDTVYHDHLPLEVDEPEGIEREWKVGVNFFSPQGHGRWWHDHRIPGGIVLSANSVGHMVCAATRLNALTQLDGVERGKRTIADLGNALKHAMLTIAGAADAVSGKATWLRPSDSDTVRCPLDESKLPDSLRGMSCSSYLGWYHTDYTIPSCYFDGSMKRPEHINQHDLDFTYLHDDSFGNPEFETMGKGVIVR